LPAHVPPLVSEKALPLGGLYPQAPPESQAMPDPGFGVGAG
jgi:hypothetical protein